MIRFVLKRSQNIVSPVYSETDTSLSPLLIKKTQNSEVMAEPAPLTLLVSSVELKLLWIQQVSGS